METRRKRGFTLVELVIVIAVIAVLAAVLIPTFMTVVDNSKFSADVQAARNMSTLAKGAALNGPTDAEGKDMLNISMNETSGVIAFLKAQGFDLKTKSKDSAFWYNRATGDVKVIRNVEMFDPKNNTLTAGSLILNRNYANSVSTIAGSGNLGVTPMSAAIGTPEKEFKQDCLESLVPALPSYVYIDQSEKNPVSVAINAIKTLVPAGATKENFLPTAQAMRAKFVEVVNNNAGLKKVFGASTESSGANVSKAYSHMLGFSPDNCLYVSNNGAFTSSGLNAEGTAIVPPENNISFTRGMFMEGITTFGSWQNTAPLELQGKQINFVEPVTIPATVTSFEVGAMRMFDDKSVFVVNKEYKASDWANSGCSSVIINNTGTIQITYKYLQYSDFKYAQYGVRYYNYTVGATEEADTTNYISNYAPLATLEGNLESLTIPGYGRGVNPTVGSTYKKIQSIYALPNSSISGVPLELLEKDAKGNIVINKDGPDLGKPNITLDCKFYSNNVGNLTVMYGSIISGNATYKIQDMAYIKQVSTYTANSNGMKYFMVSDPLAGANYYNLQGYTVEAIKGTTPPIPMTYQTSGSSKGDYQLSVADQFPDKIYVKDKAGKVILVQYV